MTQANENVLRLGARGSMLSRMQSGMVADLLEKAHPGLTVELVLIKTSGDTISDRPLYEFGGKGLFTKELEQAMLKSEIDFAVHSFKDVPVTMPLVDTAELVVAAVPKREDPRDVLACTKAKSIDELPQGAKVGTGSLRRRSQLRAARPDLNIELIRGNVDTRIKKMRTGEFDAVLLALAGLKRSGLFDETDMSIIDADELLPSAGQGALCLECRRDDPRTRELLGALNDADSFLAVRLEREIVRQLNGDCHSPIAVLVSFEEDGRMRMRAAVGRSGGEPPVVRVQTWADRASAENLPVQVLTMLIEGGAERLLMG
jgi:hydroxymethylbilane synthase